MIGRRSAKFEQEFLEQATKMAQLSPDAMTAFTDAVFDRLDKGGREYGDTALERPGIELIREIKEEAADVAGWALMRAQSTDDLDDDQGQLLRIRLIRAVSCAVSLWAEVEAAQELEEEAKPPPRASCRDIDRRITAERNALIAQTEGQG